MLSLLPAITAALLLADGVEGFDDIEARLNPRQELVVAVPDPDMPVRKPDWVIAMEPEDHVAAFSPDGRVAFVRRDVPTLRLGRMIRNHVEVVAVATGSLVWLVTMWLIWRRARRRRVAGETYCRKCNYNLRGVAAGDDTACPECGAKLTRRNRVAGRGPALRRTVGFAATAIVTAWIASGFTYRGAIQEWVERNVGWHSVWLHGLTKEWSGEWMEEYRDETTRLLAINLDDGAELFSMTFEPDEHLQVVISRGSPGRLFLQIDSFRLEHSRLEMRDAMSGKLQETRNEPDRLRWQMTLIDAGSDGKRIVVQDSDGVHACDFDGSNVVVFSRVPHEALAPRTYVTPEGRTDCVRVYPPTEQAEIRSIDDGRVIARIELDDAERELGISPDHRWMWGFISQSLFSDESPALIRRRDLFNNAMADPIRVFRREVDEQYVANLIGFTPDGRYAALSFYLAVEGPDLDARSSLFGLSRQNIGLFDTMNLIVVLDARSGRAVAQLSAADAGAASIESAWINDAGTRLWVAGRHDVNSDKLVIAGFDLTRVLKGE